MQAAMMRKAAVRPLSVSSPHCVAPSARHSVIRHSAAPESNGAGWANGNQSEKSLFGENLGARDATAAELESNFSEHVLGNFDTNHIIKIPVGFKKWIGLTSKQCKPTAELQLLEEKEANLLKGQIPGWKVLPNKAGQQVIRQEWRLRNPETAATLQGMILALAQAQGHLPEITLSGEFLIAELTTPSVGGLTENDFIVAAQINEFDMATLMPAPRKRYWA